MEKTEQFTLPVYTWDEDRKKCGQCQQVIYKDTAMYCDLGIIWLRGPGFHPGQTYCIDMRTSGPCGKEATLFSPTPFVTS